MKVLEEYRRELEQKKGKASQIVEDLLECKRMIKNLHKEIVSSKKAQIIIQVVARATQEELEYQITEPVSLALSAVYPENPYEMDAEFVITGRGNTECHLNFRRENNLISPMDASGGGPVDIAGFALRLSAWSLAQPRSRPVLLLDEPFRFVSTEKIFLAGQVLKELSEQLGLQIIMITHISELIQCADKVFHVKIINGRSIVNTQEG